MLLSNFPSIQLSYCQMIQSFEGVRDKNMRLAVYDILVNVQACCCNWFESYLWTR